MEEIKTKAIILNTNDYGEADKLATVFSLEYGKITIKFNGVRKQKAKLKPLTQPFCFVEIECFKHGDFFTAKTGLVVDNFPKITTDYTRTICAYIMMEIISKVLPKNKVEPNIFLMLSNSLDALETDNPYTTTIYFIMQFFDLLGESLTINLEDNHIFLDLDLGNFINFKTPNSIEVDKRCYSVLSAIADNRKLNNPNMNDNSATFNQCDLNINNTISNNTLTDFTKSQEQYTDSQYKMSLKMLNNVFRTKYDVELNSFSFL